MAGRSSPAMSFRVQWMSRNPEHPRGILPWISMIATTQDDFESYPTKRFWSRPILMDF